MPEIIKRNKALSVSPLKSSQTVGASLAFLGINGAIPMMHGSQGCTAFGKVFFVRHFREPIPLQSSAMDQVSSVMGADENVVEGLKAIATKSSPSLIGVPTTGLAETQGCDIKAAVKTFRSRYPEFNHIGVVGVNTPDFSGCFETGFAAAVEAMIEELVPDREQAGTRPGTRLRQVNVLAGSMLTPGDVEELKEMMESFSLRPVIIPDLSDSLDGHLTDQEFMPVTVGGTQVSEFATLGEALATIAIGPSMYKGAEILERKTGVPVYRFAHLMGLEAVDEFVHLLSNLAQAPVGERLERQRAQLQDAMLDTHFMLGMARFAVALDPDHVAAWSDLVAGMGGETVAAVVPSKGPAIKAIRCAEVRIGDLEDLEIAAREAGAELLIGNSHAAESADRLGVPLIRAGFPQYDLLGGYQRCWIGYRGTRQALFDLANIKMANNHHHEVRPYHSRLAQKPEYDLERGEHDSGTSHARGGIGG